jgi:hypothetical protein
MYQQQQNKQEVSIMQLVEQHVIHKSDPRYTIIDGAAFASKNLYNAALYEIRQAFIHEGRYLSYRQMDKQTRPSSPDAHNCPSTSTKPTGATSSSIPSRR